MRCCFTAVRRCVVDKIKCGGILGAVNGREEGAIWKTRRRGHLEEPEEGALWKSQRRGHLQGPKAIDDVCDNEIFSPEIMHKQKNIAVTRTLTPMYFIQGRPVLLKHDAYMH